MNHSITHTEHRDDLGAKMGMWLFIFTELLLFGGLFIVYAVYRSQYPDDFQIAATQLNTFIGTLNTIILLVSSMTVAMSITALQKGNKKLTIYLLGITILFAIIFLVNKYFEWGAKFHHHLYPGSELMLTLKRGELLFFSLYYFMTGLHALHIVVGMVILIVVLLKVKSGKINNTDFVLLENGGLYWHLVDLIWIFLFPLLYLIT
ncbi:MAG: cytochrome C oxidase subunit III [Bacteroidetes bacterium GWA2_30_7]|nr:MAG: cytochrome C oxidase subunit III [Bacteroidetes bacterium GWA2_30_7]